ncbi:PH domain-containing protein [Janibacter sp. G56]|uniref:PH domain-containing protein n=1 Tax=Janibacter sp. G56 TaxID=3418717 RepID=UPI003D088129
MTTPTPDAPGRAAPPMAAVHLHDDGDLAWQRVSPRLATGRSIVATATVVPLIIAAIAAGIVVDHWALFVLAIALVGLLVWVLVVVRRQVAATSWVELDEDLVIRRGIMFRRLASLPYGRLQYIDMNSGPLARRLGYTSLTMHTASPGSSGSLPGVPIAEAEALRTRVLARGESQRAGL